MPIPEPVYQNSAGRLLAVLNAMTNGNAYVAEVPKIFGTEPTSEDQRQQVCLAGLMEIHKLYLEFYEDMLEAQITEPQRKVLLSGLGSLRQSIYPIQLNAGYRAPTDAEKSLLEVCATILAQDSTLEKDDIAAIRESIS